MQDIYQQLKTQYQLGEITEQKASLLFIDLDKAYLVDVINQLKLQYGFTHLVLLTAVDWLEEGLFQLTYLVHNRAKAQDIGLRVKLPRDNASMTTIHHIWPTAETYQRELKEMFGIDFPGSPRVDDDFILEGWDDIPPYRRDFDTLAYAQANYAERPGRETHDPEQHMKQHMYPDK